MATNNELDTLLINNSKHISGPPFPIDGNMILNIPELKQQLSNLIKEIIGRKKPYEGGDFGYWSGQQYLREDQRQRATNLGFNIGDK